MPANSKREIHNIKLHPITRGIVSRNMVRIVKFVGGGCRLVKFFFLYFIVNDSPIHDAAIIEKWPKIPGA